MPMAAMFLRNKILAWAALFTTIQAWLNQPKKIKSDAQPAGMSVILAIIGLCSCYVDLIIPQKGPIAKAAKAVVETVSTTAAAATASA